MRKSLFGYNCQDVDDNIEELEAEREKLTRRIRNLTDEMEKIRLQMQEQDKDKKYWEDQQSQVEELQKKCSASEKETRELRNKLMVAEQENEELKNGHTHVAEKQERDEAEQVGIICREAYEDMAKAKGNTKEAIEQFIGHFFQTFDDYEQKILALYEEMTERNIASRELFLTAADDIYAQYEKICDEDLDMQDHVADLTNLRAEAQKDLEQLLQGLTEEDRFHMTREKESARAEERRRPSFQEMSRKRRVISLRQDKEMKECKQDADIQPQNDGCLVDITTGIDKKNIM